MDNIKKDYNDEPVEYCLACNSLHILEDASGNTICGSCGVTNFTATTSIDAYLTHSGDDFLSDAEDE
ncbi:MAG: hypothetical protein N4A76_00955 [Firmicutes bacterium]|jgi:hypothetical protein|nr:hypothetical protein [Bacillota bacterium]